MRFSVLLFIFSDKSFYINIFKEHNSLSDDEITSATSLLDQASNLHFDFNQAFTFKA